MNFVSINRVRQETDSVDSQDASPTGSSAEAPAFQRHLSEVARPSAPVLMQVRAQADARQSEAWPAIRASAHSYPPAPDGEGTMLNSGAFMEPSRVSDRAVRHSASHDWPEVLLAEDQDQFQGIMNEPLPASSLESTGEDEAMPGNSAQQKSQPIGVLVGRSKKPLYAEDALLIPGLKQALLKGGADESTATSNVGHLRSFARWLFANRKPSIAARLHNNSMDEDVDEFVAKGGTTNVRWALAHLLTSQSTGGIAPIAGRPDLTPYPEDVALIKQYKQQAVTAGTANTARTYAALLTDFSHYLRANNQPGIAARLQDETWNEEEALNEEIKRFKDAGGHRSIGAALEHLREGARKLNAPPLHSEDALLISRLQDALVEAEYKEITAKANYVRPLRRFSRWLFANNKLGIAARLNDDSLASDAAMFDKSKNRVVLCALDRLRASQSASGVASITRRTGDIAATVEQGGAQPAFSWPAQLSEGDDQSLFLGRIDEAGASSRLQPPRHGLALDPAQSLSPLNWRHHAHELAHRPLVTGEEILASDEHDTGKLRSAKRQKTLSNPEGVALERQIPAHQLGTPPSLGQASMPSRAHEYAPAAYPAARHDRDTARQHNALHDAVSSPVVLSKGHAHNQLSAIVDGGPSPSALVEPELLQWAEQAGPQEPTGSTSTWSPQMPLDFDWSMWPSSEAAPALAAPAQISSRSHQLREGATFPSTLNLSAAGRVQPPEQLTGEQLPAEDAELLARFRVDAERRQLTPGAIKNSVSGLSTFVRWINASYRGPLASRLRDGSSLDEEIAAYKSLGRDPQNRVKSALDVLRRLLRGGEEAEAPQSRVLGAPRRLAPHPEDAPLIEGALRQALNELRNPTAKLREAAQKRATRLRALSAWLEINGRGTITGRLNGSSKEQLSLDNDVLAFQRTGGRVHGPDLSHLRSYLQLVEANQALRLQGPSAGWPRPPQALPATPATPSEGAWALLRKQMQELASPPIARTPSDTFGGLASFVDLNAPTPSELHDDADFAPAHPARARSDTYSGLESFVDLNAPTPSELHDDAHFAPAPPARAPSGNYRDVSLVDLTTPTPSGLSDEVHSVRASPTTSSDAQIGTSGPAASLRGRSGLALGDEDWLGDEHISGDYALLEQELQRDNPDLAARTRFADPLIANYHLRLGAPDVALRAFQRMVFDRNGTDAADFLFLPVNDASATDPDHRGTHWSLLLVDRRDRESPVAYHYDSLRRQNGERAAMLAQRLGARLEPVRMAQQQNGFDCGVFVVDGTRTLVRRLAQRLPPAGLHLDNLVADRQALRNRLKG